MTVADLMKKVFTDSTPNAPKPRAVVTQVTIGRTRDLIDAKYYYVSTTISPPVTFKFRGPAPVEECVAFVVEQMGKRGISVPKEVVDKMMVDDEMATDANVDRDVPI